MTTTACPNCSTPVTGQYCSNCGQIQKDIRRFFLALVNEALDDVFSLNSRMWKTLVAILFKPGFLTNEYLRGRRVSYVQPIRLYFITSIAFFLMLSIVNFFSPPTLINSSSANTQSVSTSEPTQTPESEETRVKDSPQGQNQESDLKIVINDDKDIEETLADIDESFADGDFDFNIASVSEEQQAKLKALFKTQLKKVVLLAKEDSRELISRFLEIVPPIIFILLPLFAILLKILYVFRGVYYTEHFIYAVHNHCFVYLTLLFYTIAELALRSLPNIAEGLSFVVAIWIPVYLWISLKRVYGQGKFFTTLKFIGLGISYSMLLGVGIVITILIGVVTL